MERAPGRAHAHVVLANDRGGYHRRLLVPAGALPRLPHYRRRLAVLGRLDALSQKHCARLIIHHKHFAGRFGPDPRSLAARLDADLEAHSARVTGHDGGSSTPTPHTLPG